MLKQNGFIEPAVGASIGGLGSAALYRLLSKDPTNTGTLYALLAGSLPGAALGYAGRKWYDDVGRAMAEANADRVNEIIESVK